MESDLIARRSGHRRPQRELGRQGAVARPHLDHLRPVSLVQVLTPVTYAQQQIMQPGLPWWDADMTIAKEYLSDAASYLRAEGVSVTTDVVLGEDVSATILDYAANIGADIIALATSGSGGMNRFVFGTVADEVTRKSPVSVLVFHPKPHIVGEMTPGGLQSGLATTADVTG